jgi:OOP family OmpA-OmpF porin
VLAGHTLSARHEWELAQVAKSSYPNDRVTVDFKPLGVVPDYWADVTVQALYLLAGTRDAEATISTTGLSVRGVISDESEWQSRLAIIKSALPAEFEIAAEMLYVDSGIRVSDLCERAFSTFSPGSIEFEESSTELRSSAYPRLDRVIALAAACEHSRILITGHTDATGNAALNQALSLKRAARVADYVADGGIDRSRLVVSGAGSARPIADDSTRHGRSLNRRIEIVFERL